MESRRRLQQFAESTRELWSRPEVRQAVRDNLEKLTKCRTFALEELRSTLPIQS